MTLQQLRQKKHIFKHRILQYTVKQPILYFGDIGLYTLKPSRYELLYLRFLKKFIRRRHMKAKMKFKRRKYWLFLKPNRILSTKATNARMGAGTGSIVRVAIFLPSYKIFVELKDFSHLWVSKLYTRLRFRYTFKFLHISKNY